mmetsp:Transcript_7853/g.11045  ORF Transcript_7853/g.11045 Transcript_7853/m.11045 type:complete len:98 (+) Transcript_7853:202-495(+)
MDKAARCRLLLDNEALKSRLVALNQVLLEVSQLALELHVTLVFPAVGILRRNLLVSLLPPQATLVSVFSGFFECEEALSLVESYVVIVASVVVAMRL